MADIKVRDLPITIAPALGDFAINDLADGTITQKTTWQKVKDLIVPPSPLTASARAHLWNSLTQSIPAFPDPASPVVFAGIENQVNITNPNPTEIVVGTAGSYSIVYTLLINPEAV